MPRDILSQRLRIALMSRADAQLCYSEAGASYLRRHLPRRQGIFVAPNTLDMDTIKATAKIFPPSNGAISNLLLIGRVTRDKRMDVAVRAFGMLQQSMPEIRLNIVGDGPAMEDLRREAAASGDSVKFLGPIYDDERLAGIYQESSLMLVSGAAGLNVNQSLAFGVPVMLFDDAFAVLHHPEHAYIRDGVNGYRVSPPTAEAMAQRLQAVLSQGSPRQLLAAGIEQTVNNDMSLDRMIDGMRDLDKFLRGLTPRLRSDI